MTIKTPPWTPAEQDHAKQVLEAALQEIERRTDWGTFDGRRRLPCPEQPLVLLGAPLGQYHCPGCGEMQVAGTPHLPPPVDYEEQYGDWPPGYADPDPAEPDEPQASTLPPVVVG